MIRWNFCGRLPFSPLHPQHWLDLFGNRLNWYESFSTLWIYGFDRIFFVPFSEAEIYSQKYYTFLDIGNNENHLAVKRSTELRVPFYSRLCFASSPRRKKK